MANTSGLHADIRKNTLVTASVMRKSLAITPLGGTLGQVGDAPQGDAPIVAARDFLTDVFDNLERRREVEGFGLQVDRPEFSGLDVHICSSKKSCSQQVEGAASLNVGERLEDCSVGEMDQTITAEDEVRLWQKVTGKVEVHKSAGRGAIPGEQGIVVVDDVRHDVGADVKVNVQFDLPHPVHVAAGDVEKHTYAPPPDQLRKRCPDVGGSRERRSQARARLLGSPRTLMEELCKNLLWTQSAEVRLPDQLAVEEGVKGNEGREFSFDLVSEQDDPLLQYADICMQEQSWLVFRIVTHVAGIARVQTYWSLVGNGAAFPM